MARPYQKEPLHRPHIKDALLGDFGNYLKILKSVHSGADLNECVEACAGRLGGVSGALEYVRKMQGGGGDVIDLLTASLEARTTPACS